MLLLTGLCLLCLFWTASCTEQIVTILARNSDNSGGFSVMRGKRGVDIGLMFKNLLMNSAQANIIKTNALVYKTQTLPSSMAVRTTSMPAAPPNMLNNTASGRIGFRGLFQGQIVPRLGFNYQDSEAPMSSTSMAPLSRRPTPTRSSSEPIPSTVQPPSQPNPKKLLKIQTIPNSPYYLRPAPIFRFGNRLYNGPTCINFDYYQKSNGKTVQQTNYNNADYQEYQQRQSPAQQHPQQQQEILINLRPNQSRNTEMMTIHMMPDPPAPEPLLRQPPSQLRNKLVYQFAQPEDTFFDEPASAGSWSNSDANLIIAFYSTCTYTPYGNVYS